MYALSAGTMGTTVEGPVRLYPMAQDFTTTMITVRSQGVDRTFETVERVRPAGHAQRKSLIVFVAAGLTPCHGVHSFVRRRCASWAVASGKTGAFRGRLSHSPAGRHVRLIGRRA